MSTPALLIRPSTPPDLSAIAEIYADAVLHGTGSFDLDVPEPAALRQRWDEVAAKGLPWLVAESGGQVLGYACANHLRPRLGYRYCVEDSIYLHPDAKGRGLGTLLLAELIARCEAAGVRQMVAMIGDSQNLGSIGVHRRLGFEHQGVVRSAGRKFNRWLDLVIMQRPLGGGDQTPPGA